MDKKQASAGDKKECAAAKEECEEAVVECEEAIRECEEASLSCRYLLSVCVIVIILLGSLILYINLPYDEEGDGFENMTVYYLMPVGCVECNPLMIEGISSELELDIKIVESDSVLSPSVLVVYEGRSTLGLAKSRLNVLSMLCDFTGVKKSCDLRLEDIDSMVVCLSGYNISADTVVFFTQDGCDRCSDMKPLISQLKGEGYGFYTIDVDDEDELAVAEACLSDILDLEGVVPQFACAGKGRSRLGAFTSIEQMRDFADECGGV